MQLLSLYNNTKQHRLIDKELKLFELSVWLHAFSRALISVFFPILLLNLGFSLYEVIIYYFLYNLIDVPLNFFARWLIKKIGARLVIIISSLLSVLFFLALYELAAGDWALLVIIAILAALYDVFYWVAHIYLFMSCSKNDDNISKDTSSLAIVRELSSILAPALGAAILIFFNSKFLIVASIIILVISIAPLFAVKDLKDKPQVKKEGDKKFFKNKNIIQDYISIGLLGVHESVESVIWPVFIYILFKSIESVAVLPMIVAISSMIFTYFIGKTAKEKRSTMIVLGGFLIALTWLLRLTLSNTLFYYISVFMAGFFAILINIPLDSDLYEKGEKIDALSASTYRNTFSMGGKALLYLALIILLNIFHTSFLSATVCLVFLALLNYLFIRRNKLSLSSKAVKDIR
jgi:MFS family permease